MKFLYFIFFELVTRLLPILGWVSPKVSHFLKGRVGIIAQLQEYRSKNPGELIWFHVASLGEYEQARPVISMLKSHQPDTKVVLSFFSPSGYDNTVKRPNPDLDYITYLPLDRKSWMEKFVSVMKPDQVFFVKYDLWYHLISSLKNKGIPSYLIAASFRPNQIYFSWYGGFFRKMLFDLDWIFTQNRQSLDLLRQHRIQRVSLAGDTRFDRVAATASSPKPLENIRSWIGDRPVVVVGSAWEEDMRLLIPLINSRENYKWIIAPHDLDPEPMDRWSKQIVQASKKYSGWTSADSNSVLFIDNIGMLSSLYQFARIAYVGGAFGKGLHNILEPLGFSVPVVFGKVKRESKFPEATQAQQEGCGFSVENEQQLFLVFSELEKEETYRRAASSAKNWVNSNLGSAGRIVTYIHSTKKSL
ncbi:3-deoxy-D-manno-octulosonic acid transferase [Algoriphagus aquatilis]|uniref:3-deoxy-D-manno-octulosonic acid transferase n=1 Tax=Algoriphagus aquatilis TaxID=490186 RepID=A0ABW0BWS5_9BACT